MVEGYSDELFVKKFYWNPDIFTMTIQYLGQTKNLKCCFFANVLVKLGIDVRIYFDKDDESVKNQHKEMNEYIRNNYENEYYLFDINLEEELKTGSGKNKLMSAELMEFLNTWHLIADMIYGAYDTTHFNNPISKYYVELSFSTRLGYLNSAIIHMKR